MELEVEEHGVAAGQDRLQNGWSGRNEQFQADLEPRAGAFEALDKVEGRGGVWHIEGNNQALAGGFE